MLYQLCVNEFAKVLRRRGIYLFLAAVVGLYGIIGIGMKFAIASGETDMYLKYGVEAMTGNIFPLIIVTELAGTIAPLFALFLSGLLVTGELADGTVKLSLLRPVRRVSFVAAKFTVVAALVGVFLAVSFGASLVIGITFFGWSGEFIFLGATLGWAEGVFMAIATYALAALPAVGFAAVALLIAFNTRTVAGALGIGLGVYAALSLGGSLVEPLRPFLVTSYGSLALGIYPDVELSMLVSGGVVSIVYVAVFSVVAALQFNRRDVLA